MAASYCARARCNALHAVRLREPRSWVGAVGEVSTFARSQKGVGRHGARSPGCQRHHAGQRQAVELPRHVAWSCRGAWRQPACPGGDSHRVVTLW
jgi:hypothetical protein